jgi:Spy/CpxP family protein refolding chaperone
MLKKSIAAVLILAGALFLPGTTLAQQAQPATQTQQSSTPAVSDKDIQMLRADIRSQRKQIIAANLPLTDAEATKFWPVYDAYMQEVSKNADGRVALIKEYAQTYDTMTDTQALSLVKRWGSLDQAFTNTRVNWMPKFEAVLPGKKAALFYQLDRRLSQVIDLQMMSLIPLIAQ